MQIRLYNASTQDGIILSYEPESMPYFILPFFTIDYYGDNKPVLKLTQVINGVEQVFYQNTQVTFDEFRMMSVSVEGRQIDLYLDGELLWSGLLDKEIEIDTIDKRASGYGTVLLDELLFLSRSVSGNDIRRWYNLDKPFHDNNPVVVAPNPKEVSAIVV